MVRIWPIVKQIYEANKFALNTTNEVGKVGTVGYDSILSDYLSKLQDNYNNSSKIVDENGEPLVVWTGTDSAFNEFKPKKIGTRTDSGMSGKGFYFGKKNYAKRYEGSEGVTRAFFLNIKFYNGQNLAHRQAKYFSSEVGAFFNEYLFSYLGLFVPSAPVL